MALIAGPSPFELVTSLHNQVLRILARESQMHCAGLRQGARHLRGRLPSKLVKRIEYIDPTFNVSRHITAPFCKDLLDELCAAFEAPAPHSDTVDLPNPVPEPALANQCADSLPTGVVNQCTGPPEALSSENSLDSTKVLDEAEDVQREYDSGIMQWKTKAAGIIADAHDVPNVDRTVLVPHGRELLELKCNFALGTPPSDFCDNLKRDVIEELLTELRHTFPEQAEPPRRAQRQPPPQPAGIPQRDVERVQRLMAPKNKHSHNSKKGKKNRCHGEPLGKKPNGDYQTT